MNKIEKQLGGNNSILGLNVRALSKAIKRSNSKSSCSVVECTKKTSIDFCGLCFSRFCKKHLKSHKCTNEIDDSNNSVVSKDNSLFNEIEQLEKLIKFTPIMEKEQSGLQNNDSKIIIKNDSNTNFIESYHLVKRTRKSSESEIHHIRCEVFIINVFVGGKASNQNGPFFSALEIFKKKYTNSSISIQCNSLYVTDVRTNKNWNETSLVDWLLNCDAHFILTHIHQALDNILNCKLLYDDILRLSNHLGFPTGTQLTCPIFTQDKNVYLQSIEGMICPTYIFLFESFPTHIDKNLEEYKIAYPILTNFLIQKNLGKHFK
jgi:hypothetical protein